MIQEIDIDKLKKSGKIAGIFYFKHFRVEDNLSTMKVGTDAVLLGASVLIGESSKILEIGTGCGVIALILAQRSQAQIDALDIDEESVDQARSNVAISPWQSRVNVICSSLQNYISHSIKKYDLIISNPPYFSNSLKSEDQKRNLSRHNDSLSFEELSHGISILLEPGGSFWGILPAKESSEFIKISKKHGLHPHRITKVFPKTGKACSRTIFQLKNNTQDKIEENDLIIRNEDNSFTEAYANLTKELYLDF